MGDKNKRRSNAELIKWTLSVCIFNCSSLGYRCARCISGIRNDTHTCIMHYNGQTQTRPKRQIYKRKLPIWRKQNESIIFWFSFDYSSNIKFVRSVSRNPNVLGIMNSSLFYPQNKALLGVLTPLLSPPLFDQQNSTYSYQSLAPK